MNKIFTIIIPVHVYNEDVANLLPRAISSIPEGFKIIISCANGILTNLQELVGTENITFVENPTEGVIDFPSLVNQGVEAINGETEYFSILEFDDVYTNIWFNNVERYIEYHTNNGIDVSVYLPMEDILEFTENLDEVRFIGFGNEAPWASSFSDEIGFIDNGCLENFFDFYLTGSVFKTSDWIGLKPSLKVSFWYEFLLRLTSKGKKVYVIPRIGYKHYVNREGSLYLQYRESMTDKESTWWFETAKEESKYDEDRNVTYIENNNEEGE